MPLQTKKPLTAEQKAFISGAKYGDNTSFEDSPNSAIGGNGGNGDNGGNGGNAVKHTKNSKGGYTTKDGIEKQRFVLTISESQIKELKRRALDRGISVSEMVVDDLGL